MRSSIKWVVTKDEQKRYTEALVSDLVALRGKAGISQGEIAYLMGISRQTYSAVETGRREMSWTLYLALISFFDSCDSTRHMLRLSDAYPAEIIGRFNGRQVAAAI